MINYVGSYTSMDRNGRGKGITVFHSERLGHVWTHIQTLSADENPSLLRIAPGGRVLYAVHGGRKSVSAFTIAPDGQLTAFGSVASGGENPVDIGFLADGRFLVTANYTSGTVALLGVGPDSALTDVRQIITVTRPGYDGGPLASMPHGVIISADGTLVLIPAKGLDCIFVFRFDPAGRLVPADIPYASCKAGTGPRHAVFHPRLPFLYVVGELGCSVQVFHWNATTGELLDRQVVSSLPAGVDVADNLAAEIAVSHDGRDVYASNRGHNSIAHFRVDEATGLLGPAVCTSCLGKEPRLFALEPSGHVLHVANQESDTIASFPLDDVGDIGAGYVSAQVASPSSICFGPPTS